MYSHLEMESSRLTIQGCVLRDVFGECENADDRPITISASANNMEISEDQGLRSKKIDKISYNTISAVTWDHYVSAVKVFASFECSFYLFHSFIVYHNSPSPLSTHLWMDPWNLKTVPYCYFVLLP